MKLFDQPEVIVGCPASAQVNILNIGKQVGITDIIADKITNGNWPGVSI